MGVNQALNRVQEKWHLEPKGAPSAPDRKGWTQLQSSEATKPHINVFHNLEDRAREAFPRSGKHSEASAAALEVRPEELCEGRASEPDLVKVPMAAMKTCACVGGETLWNYSPLDY